MKFLVESMRSLRNFNQRFFTFCIFVLALVACDTQPVKDTDGLIDIIPTAEKDYGPDTFVDVSNIPDAVPRYDPRTIAGNKSPYKVKGIVYRVMNNPVGYKDEGIASWYGKKFHGNKTSNGEVYDMYGMTGAHKTLPLPAYVRVTNLQNKKSIVVRLNDRGPFASGRIIDLSYAGAQKLGYAHAGTARVRVEYIDTDALKNAEPVSNVNVSNMNVSKTPAPVVPIPPVNREPQLYLQVGAYTDAAAALTRQFQVAAHTQWPVFVEKGLSGNTQEIHRVYIGPIPDEQTITVLKQALVLKGLPEPLRVLK